MKKPRTKVLGYEAALDWIPQKVLVPASRTVPQWYRDENRSLDVTAFDSLHIKHCVPFLDALTLGYVFTTPIDLYVTQTPEGPRITWGENADFVRVRDKGIAPTLPIPSGYSDTHFLWFTHGCVVIPDGYSVLFTHPLNHVELPFFTLSGVLDSTTVHRGHIPFFLKEGFEGLIPAGTPYLQLIPFKRENWESKEVKGAFAESEKASKLSRSFLWGWYRKNIWSKKSFT